ncbi:fasciclin domain-containing protein [Winogradskyella schleiferi]|uniref:fasciclin domain-containing protein n=1 Tax=Winogradskyella schleiferi TaxID=2686078 RepID=UPI0015BCD9D7|nr:fasciclin domain-containing protein [Winogradskyella schleiferi]
MKTFNGGYIALTVDDNNILITDELCNQSEIIQPDQEAENGVVHGISEVLIPQ